MLFIWKDARYGCMLRMASLPSIHRIFELRIFLAQLHSLVSLDDTEEVMSMSGGVLTIRMTLQAWRCVYARRTEHERSTSEAQAKHERSTSGAVLGFVVRSVDEQRTNAHPFARARSKFLCVREKPTIKPGPDECNV
uniref:SFRICE_021015 n=1 Tax=Spodoptera frugiperda TaxID=7108 RepID=A0A2H1W9K5_SPOFR